MLKYKIVGQSILVITSYRYIGQVHTCLIVSLAKQCH